MKKILALVACLSLVASLAVGGSIAYLQDQKATVNVMTLGNVKIEQHELQRKAGVDYKNGGQIADGDELEPFKNGNVALYPAVYSDLSDYSAKEPGEEQFWWGSYVTADVSGNGSSNGLWDDKLKNVVDKFVFVENTGKSDAYYRTIIAYECPEGMDYSQSYDKEFMNNVNLNDRFVWSSPEEEYVVIDGTRYLIEVATYQKVLEPGTISRPSLLQVVMTHNATNEDMELLGENYEILVLSQAVQTAGFDTAEAALTAAFGEINEANIKEWFKDTTIPTYASNAEELAAALNKGGTVMLSANIEVSEQIAIPTGVTATLNLNGKTLSSALQDGSTNKHIYPISNSGNLTIEGGTIEGRGIFNQDGATLTVNGATIKNLDFNGGACIWSYGTGEVYLNDANLIGNTGCVSSEGYLEINGGTYTCYSGITDDGTKETSPTYNIRSYNGLKITDGTFTSRHGVISVGGGDCVIEDGDFTIQFATATTSNVVYAYDSADLTINGGDFISDNSTNKADSGAAVLVSGSNAHVTIHDGKFVGMNGMVSGNATLYGGNYNTVWNYNHYDKLENLLADGYQATQNADGSWTVTAQ